MSLETSLNIKNIYCSIFLMLEATSTYSDPSKEVFRLLMNNEDIIDELEAYILSDELKEERNREIKLRSRSHQMPNHVIDKSNSNIVFYIEYYKTIKRETPQEIEHLCNYCRLTQISRIYNILYSFEEALLFEGVTSEDEIYKFLSKYNNPTLRLLLFFAKLTRANHEEEIKKIYTGTMLDTDPDIFKNIDTHIKKVISEKESKLSIKFRKK